MSGDQFKIFIETGEIIKSTLETDLLNAKVILDEQFTGMAHAQFEEKSGIGLSCPRFEEAAKGVGADIGHGCDLFQLDGAAEMAQAIIIDAIDAFVAGAGEAVAKAHGGEGIKLVRFGKDMHGFHQEDHAGHAFRIQQGFEQAGDLAFGFAFYLETPSGPVDEGLEADVFGKVEKRAAPAVFGEMGDKNIDRSFVETPIMGQVGTHQYNIAGSKPADIVAHELGAVPLLEMKQFYLRVKMPFVVDIWREITTNAKRVSGLAGNFKQLRSHSKVYLDKRFLLESCVLG